MLEGPHSPGAAGEAQRIHCYALAISQFREAAKALNEELVTGHPLVMGLAANIQQDLEVIRASWGESFVKTTVTPVRDVIFHYAADRAQDREAWAWALRELADEPCLIHEGPYDLEHRWLFADQVRGRLIPRCPGEDFTQFSSDAQRLRELVLSLIRVCDAFVAEHIHSKQREGPGVAEAR
jgi:hypothetical protein